MHPGDKVSDDPTQVAEAASWEQTGTSCRFRPRVARVVLPWLVFSCMH